ncbi:MAG TPA: hypothetical protein VIP11_21140 [Gemmatimonadaceae bacterium]
MKHLSVSRRTLALVSIGTATLMAACGEDKRVKELSAGITRDSAVTVLAQDIKGASGPDAFPNVYKRDAYLIDGKDYEVLYFSAENKKFMKDSVQYSELTPIVFVNNILYGKGWQVWDSIAAAHKIPVPDHKAK